MKKINAIALASHFAAVLTAITPLHAATAEGAPEARIVLDDADNGRVFEGIGGSLFTARA